MPYRFAGVRLSAAFPAALAATLLSGLVTAADIPEPEEVQEPEDLRYFTEQYPPYNYKEDGRLQGLMIDTWEELWERMDADLDRSDIIHAPWARGYHELQEWPGTALAVMTYTEDRDEYMEFVGPLVDVRFVLFSRAEDDIELADVDDALDYTIGTVRDDIGEQLLTDEGLDVEEFERLKGPAQAAELLAEGRIDLWSYQEDVARFEMQEAGLDPENFDVAYVVDRGTLMLAFHEETPQPLLDEFQGHLDDMRDDGALEEIINRHLER